MGGFVLAAAQPADEQLGRDQPAAFWGRGAQDGVITPTAIERTAGVLPAHVTLVQRVYPGLAHGINLAEITDVRAFLGHPVRGGRDRNELLRRTTPEGPTGRARPQRDDYS